MSAILPGRPCDGPKTRRALDAARELASLDPIPEGDDENARRRCAIQACGLEEALKHPSPPAGSPFFSVPGVTMPWGMR